MLRGPNGILELNLVLRNKIHELCGWVDGHKDFILTVPA
jgi:hypothetical protein